MFSPRSAAQVAGDLHSVAMRYSSLLLLNKGGIVKRAAKLFIQDPKTTSSERDRELQSNRGRGRDGQTDGQAE